MPMDGYVVLVREIQKAQYGAHKEQEVSYEDSHGADIHRKRNPRVFHL